MFFTWNGRRIEALPGDTIAMALWRGGVLASGVSRKRYRPLGASGSHLQGVLVTVNGQPHVRADQTEVLQRVSEGKSHIEELKRSTSCGMGPCQGFPCWELLRAVTATATGREAYDRPTHRPPRRGLTVAQAAALDGLLELE